MIAALAAEPVITVEDDSWVEARIDLSASPEAVYAVISRPDVIAAIDGSTTVTVESDGECVRVDTRVDHPIASVTYQTRSCPDGELAVRQVLVGGDMKAFESRWWLEPQGDGTRVHYRIRTVPKIPVPRFVVDRNTVKGTRRMLERLRDHLEHGPPRPR